MDKICNAVRTTVETKSNQVKYIERTNKNETMILPSHNGQEWSLFRFQFLLRL